MTWLTPGVRYLDLHPKITTREEGAHDFRHFSVGIGRDPEIRTTYTLELEY